MNESTNKKSNVQLSRHIIQLIAFFLFPGLFVTVFSAVKDIVISTIHRSFSFTSLAPQIVLTTGMFLITILWGRFFCGYLCSFGAAGDLIYAISKKILPNRSKIPSSVDKKLKWIKYAILLFIVVGIWGFSLSIAASISPWNAFGGLVSGNLKTAGSVLTTVGFIMLLLILIGSFFIERFFCRYLCPLGAIFSLISVKRLFKIKRNEDSCTSCGLCTDSCSMGIAVHNDKTVKSGECIDCMNCISSCPSECISSNPAPAVAGTTTALVLAGLVAAEGFIPTTSSVHSATSVSSVTSGTSDNAPKINNNKIIKNKNNNNNNNIGSDSDTTDKKEFNKKEFDKKEFDKNSNMHQHKHQDKNGMKNKEKSDQSENNNKDIINSKNDSTTSSTDTNKDTVLTKDNEETSSSVSSASSTSSALDLSTVSDGTYTGTGNGYRGSTTVSVIVKDHKITDITIDSYADDEQFFSKASSGIIDSILSTQNINVSTVSGATFSSNGILEAISNSFGITYENPNSEMGGKKHH